MTTRENNNKRKYTENSSFNYKKRGRGQASSYNERIPKDYNRWQNKYPSSSNYKTSGYDSMRGRRGRYDYKPNPHHRSNLNHRFNVPPPISTDPCLDQEDLAANSERLEKVLATKKRIEEAFASKSNDTSKQDIAFDKSIPKKVNVDNKEKPADGNIPSVTSSDLGLTNSDFKEIGSVASGVVVEEETDGSDLILNVTPCSSQQRSFDNVCPTQVPSNKPPRVEGWNITSLNECESGSGIPPRTALRPGGEKYLQESREKILGSIGTSAERENTVFKKTKTSFSNQKEPSMNASRVGQLYQSFLRSRLFGFTLTLSKDASKTMNSNPFLDKSVLQNQSEKSYTDNQNSTPQVEMPRPISIKLEANSATDLESTSGCVEAVEANEFCQEFSHLLTEPNFLIPSEELEKLGLGHLAEMNEMVNDKRNSSNALNSSVSCDNYLRVRSLNALNSVTEHDINPSTSNLRPPLLNNSPFDTTYIQNKYQDINYEFVNVPGPINQSHLGGIPSQVPANSPSSMTHGHGVPPHNPLTPASDGVSVESITENVIKKLLSSGSVNPQVLNPLTESLLRNPTLQPNLFRTQHEMETPHIANHSLGHHPAHAKDPTSQLQDIGSKVLRLFVIDKQIEELMLEKKNIYTELFSIGEISSTLFNSWAQEKIQKKNPRSQVKEQSNNINPTSNININSFANTNSLNTIPGLLNEGVIAEAISKTLQSMAVDPSPRNNVDSSAGLSNFVPTQFSSPNIESQHHNQPKVSIRKDLHHTNKPSSLRNTNSCSDETERNYETLSADPTVEDEQLFESSLKNQSKKKTKKKKAKEKKDKSEEIIYLDDSSDEDSVSVSTTSGTGINSSIKDEVLVENTDNEPQTFQFDLQNKTPACITASKKTVVVGCKDGSVMVFELASDGNLSLVEKVHEESVTCLSFILSNHLVFCGSSDGTSSLFNLQINRKMQILPSQSPVQCVDVRFDKVFVGVKSGLLIIYKINAKSNAESTKAVSLKMCETRKLSNSSIISLKASSVGGEEVIVVACRGEQVAVYNLTTGDRLRGFDWCDTVHCLEVVDHSSQVFCGTHTQSVKVVNFATGENEADHLVGKARSVTKILLKGSILFAACTDGNVYIYDVKEKKLIAPVAACKGQIIGMSVHSSVIIVASNRCELVAVKFPEKVKTSLKRISKLKETAD